MRDETICMLLKKYKTNYHRIDEYIDSGVDVHVQVILNNEKYIKQIFAEIYKQLIEDANKTFYVVFGENDSSIFYWEDKRIIKTPADANIIRKLTDLSIKRKCLFVPSRNIPNINDEYNVWKPIMWFIGLILTQDGHKFSYNGLALNESFNYIKINSNHF